MPNYPSARKRLRQNTKLKEHNRYYKKTARNSVKKLRLMTDKQQAEQWYNTVASRLDRLAKRNQIHKNKANNLKSKLRKHVNNLAQ
jgi:small subunit ribosomal protein S20